MRHPSSNPITVDSPHLEREQHVEPFIAEQDENVQFNRELEEIRRYEDFTTIDWVQDASRERYRRRLALRQKKSRPRGGWFSRWIQKSFDAAQAWIVVSIVGILIGINAACVNIVTEWLSDFKLGYCSQGWYLNQQFCCWEAVESEDGCPEWQAWSSLSIINYVFYVFFAAIFSFTSAYLVRSFAPYAAGSGISEIKCIIAGFIMKGFLGFRTLVIKTLGLPLAIASGLSVGKEGPSVHVAVSTGNVVSRLFGKYKRNAAKMREIYSASSAAGVAVAFGSPIGGVLFSFEEMSSNFPLKTMWRSFFCALVATFTLAAMNPFRTGQLVMFQVHYDREWHFFEIVFYIVIGIFGGLYGSFVMKWNLRAQAFRKKYLSDWPVAEAVILASLTGVIGYWNAFLRIDMTEEMEVLFRECEGNYDYNGLCKSSERWRNALSLLFSTIVRTLLIIISYGSKVPAGIFVPSMAVGASFGRFVGILVRALHSMYPHSSFFAGCPTDGGVCITPGTYAFLGAAATLSGIMHITVSVVVIMFELTGGVRYILPTMIVVGVTKAVADCFGRGGIADRMIWFNGFPFLDHKEEQSFGVSVSTAMTRNLVMLPSNELRLHEVEDILTDTTFGGFPVVEDRKSCILLGYIGRTELRYAIDRAKKLGTVSPTAICYFIVPSTTSSPSFSGRSRSSHWGANTVFAKSIEEHSSSSLEPITSLSFEQYIDPTPLAIHPHLPLETAMELFKKLGPRVILIEQKGRVLGLLTVKDLLKWQFKAESEENPRPERRRDVEEKLWAWIVNGAKYVNGIFIRMLPKKFQRRIGERDARGNGTIHGTFEAEAWHDSVELNDR